MKIGRDADLGGADRFPTRRLSAFPESAPLLSPSTNDVASTGGDVDLFQPNAILRSLADVLCKRMGYLSQRHRVVYLNRCKAPKRRWISVIEA